MTRYLYVSTQSDNRYLDKASNDTENLFEQLVNC